MAEQNLESYQDKYSFEEYTYPSDLFGKPENYGDSWVMININSLSTSKYMTGGSAGMTTATVDDYEKKDFSNTRNVPKNVNGGAVVTAASATVAGFASLKNALSSNVGLGASAKDFLVSATKGAIVGGFAALPLYTNGSTRETKRLALAIALPMPSQLTTGYTALWDSDSTAILNATLRMGGQATEMLTNVGAATDMDSYSKLGGEAKGAAQALALGIQSAFGAGGISAASGMAYNPKKEMIFNGVGFRKFTLDYKFYPKSPQEQRRIDNIIKALKFHMHPEYQSEGRYTFIYPSEFDITFYTATNENPWINRIATCVLEGMQVNYTPDAQWAQHNYGAPNAIQVSMSFQELSILTKETIDKGY